MQSVNDGNFEILEHQGNGIYRGISILGEPDKEYSVTIDYEDFYTSASAFLYDTVEIYSVEFVTS